MGEDTPSPLGKVIQIVDDRIKSHLDRVVRGTVEETLNALLDAEADRLCNARRYERTSARRDTRAGQHERDLETKAGKVRLKVPKLRAQTFETAIIERYRRRESSVEEALIEMYLAGVSMRRVEDITEALWGTRVSPSTVSDLNKKIYAAIETWRNRPIEGEHPYVYLDGIVLKRSWAGEVPIRGGVVACTGLPESIAAYDAVVFWFAWPAASLLPSPLSMSCLIVPERFTRLVWPIFHSHEFSRSLFYPATTRLSEIVSSLARHLRLTIFALATLAWHLRFRIRGQSQLDDD